MAHRAWWSLVGFVAGAGMVAAASLAGSEQKRGGTLRISSTADVDSVDLALGYSDTSWWLEFATCAKLYNNPDRSDAAGASTIPEVATRFPSVSRDGRTQTIHLKRTYRFHTGAPITAANFVAAFNRNANPKLRSPATSYMHQIVGADAVIAGKARTISGVRAPNPYTLRIRTTRRLSDLPARLTMPFFCPIAADTPPREQSNPPGSGPYHLASRIPNRQIMLERNRFYPGSRPANIDRVVWSIGLGEEACLRAVEQNTIDYCLGRTRGYGPAAERAIAGRYGINRPGGRFFFNPTPQTFYFAFNHDRPAFRGTGQIPLKQAINLALDRGALLRAAGFLAGKPTDQILPPAMTRAANIYSLGGVTERNLRRAQASLARVDFVPEELVLYAPNDGFFPVWAQTFQRNLKRLGIDVVVKYFGFYEVVDAGRHPPGALRRRDLGLVRGLRGRDHVLRPSAERQQPHTDRQREHRTFRPAQVQPRDRAHRRAERQGTTPGLGEARRGDGSRGPAVGPGMNGTQRDFVSKSFGCYVFQPMIGHFDIGAACKK